MANHQFIPKQTKKNPKTLILILVNLRQTVHRCIKNYAFLLTLSHCGIPSRQVHTIEILQYYNLLTFFLAVDFGLLLPPCPVNPVNARSEVEMFNDLLTFRKDRTNRIERSIDKLLVHPLSQVYLHIKWEQLRKLFYVILGAHLAF